MHETAKQKGLVCLSNKYINSQTHLKWKCEKCLHEWLAKPNNIRNGKGCPKCAGNLSLDLDLAYEIAKKRGGKCLSKIYLNCKSPLEWECEEGHIWKAPLDRILHNNSWCLMCSRKNSGSTQRGSLEELQKICIERGGVCLSENYVNSQTSLVFRCLYGHIFENIPNRVKQGSWCPQCGNFKGEEICRIYLESIFGNRFPKSRPKWLKFNGNQCELDGFCKDLNIAFEHMGRFHYEVDGYYSKTLEEVALTREKDENKKELCELNGVKLIEIPEIFSLTKIKDLPSMIKKECKRLQIVLAKDPLTMEIDLNGAYKNPKKVEKILELNRIAKNHGGYCLSVHYLGFEIPHLFQCSQGHKFESIPQNILKGHWCRFCAKNIPLGIEKMKEFANQHGGLCLSENYIGVKKALKWQCKNGTIFLATPQTILSRQSFCYCGQCIKIEPIP